MAHPPLDRNRAESRKLSRVACGGGGSGVNLGTMPTEKNLPSNPKEERIAALVRELLVELGEDPEREGLRGTPLRVARAMRFLTRGRQMTPDEVVGGAVFESGTNNMVVLRDIEVYSLCEHHLLPFYGRCHVGYIARGQVLGISKIARIVDCFAARLQIQERLTEEIATPSATPSTPRASAW